MDIPRRACYNMPDSLKKTRDRTEFHFTYPLNPANISITCGGRPYNPFEQDDDGLGVTILKKMAFKIEHQWENGVNRISVRLDRRKRTARQE